MSARCAERKLSRPAQTRPGGSVTKKANPAPPGDRPTGSAPPPPPAWRFWLWPAALIIALVLFRFLTPLHANTVDLTYSQFLSRVNSHQVKTVTLSASGQT